MGISKTETNINLSQFWKKMFLENYFIYWIDSKMTYHLPQ